jgi:hypothetical protein
VPSELAAEAQVQEAVADRLFADLEHLREGGRQRPCAAAPGGEGRSGLLDQVFWHEHRGSEGVRLPLLLDGGGGGTLVAEVDAGAGVDDQVALMEEEVAELVRDGEPLPAGRPSMARAAGLGARLR